jgi:uncharacterized protein (DUF433 family)
MIEIVPGIIADPEQVLERPLIAGTRVPATQVLRWLAEGYSELHLQNEYGLTTAQISAARRYGTLLDAEFDALLGDPERNAIEAELDRRSDAELDAGGGFRGSTEELMAMIDG